MHNNLERLYGYLKTLRSDPQEGDSYMIRYWFIDDSSDMGDDEGEMSHWFVQKKSDHLYFSLGDMDELIKIYSVTFDDGKACCKSKNGDTLIIELFKVSKVWMDLE